MSSTWKRSSGSNAGGHSTVRYGTGQPMVPDAGKCTTCGKNSYTTRADAKKVAKMTKQKVGHHVGVMPCPVNGQMWHVGVPKNNQVL